jgi:hypothetical protein
MIAHKHITIIANSQEFLSLLGESVSFLHFYLPHEFGFSQILQPALSEMTTTIDLEYSFHDYRISSFLSEQDSTFLFAFDWWGSMCEVHSATATIDLVSL